MSGNRSTPAVDGLDEALDVTPSRFLHGIYAFFYNKAVGLVLILITGVLSLIGVLVPQLPAGIADNPEQEQQWLDSVQQVTGGWTPVLEAVGFFKMFSSIPFLVVLALLALSIIACTCHRIPVLWQAARNPHTRVTARFFDHARLRTRFGTTTPAAEAFATILADARRHRMRVIVDDRGPGHNAYLDRHAWAPFGTVFAHAAFVVIMVGFVVSSYTGFRDDQFTLTIGYPKAVGHGTTLVAEAKGFQDSYYADGSPSDYVADILLRDGDQEVARQEVRVNSPLSYQGVMFHQAYFGVAAVLTVTDATGGVVLDGGIPLEWSSQDKTLNYGHVTLPDGRELYVAGSASGQVGTGIEPGQVRVEVHSPDQQTPIVGKVIDMNVPTEVDSYTVTFQREQQFTGMIVRRDPGTGIVWTGFGLLVLGTCVTMFLRHQRMWVRVMEEGGLTVVRMGSPDQRDSAFTSFFTDMVERVSSKTGTHERNSDD